MKGDEFISLSPELMEKYKRQFFEPEMIFKHDGKIIVLKDDSREPNKSIAEHMKEGAEQAAKDKAARTTRPKKTDIDRD